MTYKEKIQKKIKEDNQKKLWRRIAESYEEGGIESVKMELNSINEKIKDDYEKALADIENML